MYVSRVKLLLIISILSWIVVKVDGEQLARVIRNSLTFPESELLLGILIGDKNSMGKEWYNRLINSGLIHIVVVSGSNLMLLEGGLVEWLAKEIGRKKAIMMGLIWGWKYVTIVGWQLPMVRAMLWMTFYYGGQIVGRKFDPVRGLLLVVGIMLAANLSEVSGVSFWLSIAAVVGMMTSGLVGMNNFFKKTIWVTLWVTPILGAVFGKISIISPLANLAVYFLTELVTVVGMIASVLAIVWAKAGTILWILIPPLKYLEVIINWTGKVPGLELKFNWMMVVGMYICLVGWIIKNSQKNEN